MDMIINTYTKGDCVKISNNTGVPTIMAIWFL